MLFVFTCSQEGTFDLIDPFLHHLSVFRFNIDKPEEFKGRSMSVSDVVEVTNDQGNAAFYYCDNIGFKKIEFIKDWIL